MTAAIPFLRDEFVNVGSTYPISSSPSQRWTGERVSGQEYKSYSCCRTNALPLLTADEARRIDENSAITFVGNWRPRLLTKRYYETAPNTKTDVQPPLGRPLSSYLQSQNQSHLPEFPEELRTPFLAS